MAVSGWAVLFIVLFIVLVAGGGGYIAYAHYRARRLGLPTPNLNPFSKAGRGNAIYEGPQPMPSSVLDWAKDKISGLRNQQTSSGAYHTTGYRGSARGGRRGFGPLDPDEAWDARVDNEASGYYEEQELGLQDPVLGPYSGGGYNNHSPTAGIGALKEDRGRSQSRQRELDSRYDTEMRSGKTLNPFGDHAEADNKSLRGVSPRPAAVPSYHGVGTDSRPLSSHPKKPVSLHTNGSDENSPSERRSMFHENM